MGPLLNEQRWPPNKTTGCTDLGIKGALQIGQPNVRLVLIHSRRSLIGNSCACERFMTRFEFILLLLVC